jgi:hypothetical protein
VTASILRPLRSLLARRRSERRLVVEAYAVVALVRLALTLLPYRLLRRARRPVLRVAAALGARPCDDSSLVAGVRVAARHVPGATCLTQAIALHILLARRKIASDLVVGVTRRDGRFEAHAWVDRGGETLIGGDVEHFNPLLRVGPATR